jgi:hypothetical protein
MRIIFGFGKSEEDFRKEQKEFVTELIGKLIKKYGRNGWVDNYKKIIEILDFILKKRAESYKKENDKYDKLNKSEAPEKYSYFRYSILWDYIYIVIVYDFCHTNRQHPFSPDGWATLNLVEPLVIKWYEVGYEIRNMNEEKQSK